MLEERCTSTANSWTPRYVSLIRRAIFPAILHEYDLPPSIDPPSTPFENPWHIQGLPFAVLRQPAPCRSTTCPLLLTCHVCLSMIVRIYGFCRSSDRLDFIAGIELAVLRNGGGSFSWWCIGNGWICLRLIEWICDFMSGMIIFLGFEIQLEFLVKKKIKKTSKISLYNNILLGKNSNYFFNIFT